MPIRLGFVGAGALAWGGCDRPAAVQASATSRAEAAQGTAAQGTAAQGTAAQGAAAAQAERGAETSTAAQPSEVTEQSAALIESARQSLASGRADVSAVLSDPAYMSVHPLTPFRELIRQHATGPRVGIVTAAEAGIPVVVTGTLRDESGKAAKGALVYVYQTDARGWYSADAPHVGGMSGDERHARLFGYLTTGADGRYEVRSIRPLGYPKSDLPAHIHIEVFVNGATALVSEILFDEDPRLSAEQRERAAAAKFVIAKGVPGEGGVLRYTADFAIKTR